MGIDAPCAEARGGASPGTALPLNARLLQPSRRGGPSVMGNASAALARPADVHPAPEADAPALQMCEQRIVQRKWMHVPCIRRDKSRALSHVRPAQPAVTMRRERWVSLAIVVSSALEGCHRESTAAVSARGRMRVSSACRGEWAHSRRDGGRSSKPEGATDGACAAEAGSRDRGARDGLRGRDAREGGARRPEDGRMQRRDSEETRGAAAERRCWRSGAETRGAEGGAWDRERRQRDEAERRERCEAAWGTVT